MAYRSYHHQVPRILLSGPRAIAATVLGVSPFFLSSGGITVTCAYSPNSALQIIFKSNLTPSNASLEVTVCPILRTQFNPCATHLHIHGTKRLATRKQVPISKHRNLSLTVLTHLSASSWCNLGPVVSISSRVLPFAATKFPSGSVKAFSIRNPFNFAKELSSSKISATSFQVFLSGTCFRITNPTGLRMWSNIVLPLQYIKSAYTHCSFLSCGGKIILKFPDGPRSIIFPPSWIGHFPYMSTAKTKSFGITGQFK